MVTHDRPPVGNIHARSRRVQGTRDLILCYPLLLPPSIFPSIRVFSNESVLHIRWPKHWSFSFPLWPSLWT